MIQGLTNHLSTEEVNELERCEVVIKQGLETFVEVGTALMTIRDKRLYRAEFGTFEDYCRERWAMTKTNANRLVAASQTISHLTPIGVIPTTESQARPLTKLEPELQREAWQETVNRHGGDITAAKVEETVKEFEPVNERFKELKAENRHDIFTPSPKPTEELLQQAKEERNKRNLAALEEKQEVNEIESPLVACYDANMFFKSGQHSPDRYGDKVFSLSDDKYNTVSTLSRFFHRETMREFSLREYAYVQTFPENYKFVGSYTSIKKQIGNAVAPYMGQYVTQKLKGKTIGDLFAGCGGFSCGAHLNDKETLWAVEWVEEAALSFKMNFPSTKVFNTNIKGLNPEDFEPVDIIIGGPPCQGFSSANYENKWVKAEERFKDDPRNELYKEFLRFVEVLKPGEFLMENVKEIQDVEEQIVSDFESIGYKVKTELIIGNDIGMKQNRKRFFFHGVKM